MATSNVLPPTRVVVTSHLTNGQTVFESDGPVEQFYPFGPQGTGFGRIHSRLSVPVNNMGSPPKLPPTPPKCPPQGLLFCTSDFAAQSQTPMHRTVTLDYAIVMSGEIVLKLETGEEKLIRAGEVVVQKGVNHQWINRSDTTCRMMCVMVASNKVVLDDGSVLDEAFKR